MSSLTFTGASVTVVIATGRSHVDWSSFPSQIFTGVSVIVVVVTGRSHLDWSSFSASKTSKTLWNAWIALFDRWALHLLRSSVVNA